ncbi:phosphoribosylformylglycinamidine synthase I [Haloplanus ruber]|uniref:Phosphoribosylformylglycinamidine synthase subunit PurQ n=1 Tax=Haloplanus ruber TaxID=869892 RepID=A0ABD6CUU0_9EURY|nr:phosphoribosylformylglycinamidine synthase I [Haloplanus ruber]
MTVAVIQFGGSNCDRDSVRALSHLGIDAERVWYEDGLPDDATGVMLPGGFSYGDYLRAGAMAGRTPILASIREAAAEGLPVLGVCNGAQIGCEAGLTPGAFTVNRSARFQCERIHVRVENADTPWTAAYDEGAVLELPIAHGEGRFEADDDTYDRLVEEDRILLRYCDADGDVTDAANPNGSRDNVAGVLGSQETVAVMMPHPERATLPDLGGTDGTGLLRGFERTTTTV